MGRTTEIALERGSGRGSWSVFAGVKMGGGTTTTIGLLDPPYAPKWVFLPLNSLYLLVVGRGRKKTPLWAGMVDRRC